MGREVSYDDAVTLLGGDRDKIVKLLDTLMGVGMLAALGPFRDLLGWFDARNELGRLTERLVTGLVERRSELSRWERTERLQAAHAVLAVTAFFEALAEAKLPFDYRELEFTPEEQRSLGMRGESHAGWTAPVPWTAEPHEQFRKQLTDHYHDMSVSVASFIQGLAVWDGLAADARAAALRVLHQLPDAAANRYDSLLGRMAAEFPEVAFWAGMREQNATHAQLREVTTALAGLSAVMDTLAQGRTPDDRRLALSRAYATALREPIAPSQEVPQGLRMPTLAEAFLPQLHRFCLVTAKTMLSDEDAWELLPIREDLLAFLTGHLTSPAAATTPLLILGQPGSGKSALSKLLAGRLPSRVFMPVLVQLRSVSAAADLQDQIEQAVRIDTGERVDWPTLSRSSGDALPLVILDGFDELLQATGVSQTDYLSKVAAFQRREAGQGRPVAVIVTSRTGVADRAQAAEGTVAVRLEPFDQPRVAAWLDMWNRANAGRFTAGREAPLDLDTVLRYPDLAGQPLLLLMLALYDAEGNALRSAGDLRPDQLYERLLHRFARREVDKLGAGLTAREINARVGNELYRLSVVAFAMFNRRAQWVTEADLDADLRALPAPSDSSHASRNSDLRTPLGAVDRALGSFFFVQRARATRDGVQLETYEFLHATFGEYLVARLIHDAVTDLILRERATTFLSRQSGIVDDDLLYALLSWAPLADRRQVIGYLQSMVADKTADERAEWSDLLTALIRAAIQVRPPRGFDSYRPRALAVPQRLAAYTANLLLLGLCGEDLTATRIFGRGPQESFEAIQAWHDISLLWHSQAPASGWRGLIVLITVGRVQVDEIRDLTLTLRSDPREIPPVDLDWVLSPGLTVSEVQRPLDAARREAHFTCDVVDDLEQHALNSLAGSGLDRISGSLVDTAGGRSTLLAEVLHLVPPPAGPVEQRVARYLVCAAHASANSGYLDLLLHRVATDRDLGADDVVDILIAIGANQEKAHRVAKIRCAVAHLSQDVSDDAGELASYVEYLLRTHARWTEIEVEAAIRLAELGREHPRISELDAERLLDDFGAGRPDFVERIRKLVVTVDGGPER